MGIQGLLPFLKKIHSTVNVSKFEGCTVAIDAYCWLHKGAFACADKLALGEKTDQYVYYCMKYLDYMQRKNVKPIMVFDGCRLPSKKDVEKNRKEKREMYRKKAAQMLREGKRTEARECLQRCIDISPEMALELMKACRARGIDCIVAPYEADAQLAYLSKQGIAQVIITEDSDLLLFGCERVIFKMDHFGNGVMIESRHLNEVLGIAEGYYTFEKFRHMCIMSGCDYLPSLPGIGLGKASKVFKLARQTDLRQLLRKFPSTYLKMSMSVPQDYIENFIKADNTFLYQLVYNPLKRELVPLNPYPPEINRDEMQYAGPHIPAEKALQIALGNINIYSGEKFANFDPDVPQKTNKKPPTSLHMLSIWNRNYRIRPKFDDNQNSDENVRPNLKGKEMKCSVILPKRSPNNKRQRTGEKCVDTKSDTELSSFYNSTSPLKEEFSNRCLSQDSSSTISPCKKKLKLDPECFSENQENSDSEMEDDHNITPQKHSKLRNKSVFSTSLKEADTSVSVNTLAVPEDASPKDTNSLQSPKRNRFAVMLAKRPRFDVNATKEVKSRYFVSSSPNKRNDLPKGGADNSCEEIQPASQQPTEQNLDKQSSFTQNKLKSPNSTGKINIKNQKKSSPGSAFSWSKFKFSKQTEKQSPNVNSQFKNVANTNIGLRECVQKSLSDRSRAAGESEIKIKDDVCAGCPISSSQSDSQSNNLGYSSDGYHGSTPCMPEEALRSSPPSDSSEALQGSQSSLYGSIDSFCMSSSQVSLDTPPTLPVPQTSGSQGDAEESPRSTSALTSAAGVQRSVCRVSGLSRGKKTSKSTAKSKVVDTKQRSIKDLLSKFSHNSSAPKLKHPSSSVETENEVEITMMTPSLNSKVLSTIGGVQRKIF